MKVGDMVKIKKPTTTCYADKLFLVTDTMMMGECAVATWGEEHAQWVRLNAPDGTYRTGWTPATDYEVVSESGNKSKT